MTKALKKVRVSFLEWVDPIYCGGHWIPQMLEWAGAEDPNSRDGTDSVRIPWEQVQGHRPEVILVSPCGFKTSKALEQAVLLRSKPGWSALPAVKNGKPDGFKLYAIRPSSAFAKLGLTNGDTLQSINGFELTSADKALEVYTKLREATSLEVEITRRGKPVTLKYSIK